MARVEANGVAFEVDVQGAGPLTWVFIHGWACDATTWQPQVANLATSYRCVNINLRGLGGSEAAAPYDVSTAARDVIAIMEELATGPSVICGHSLGGLVALLVNHFRPDLVIGTVLGDSPLTAASGGGFALTVQLIRDSGSMSVLESLVEGFFVDSTPDDVREKVRKLFRECPPEIGAGMLDSAEILSQKMGELLHAADRKPFMAFWSANPRGNPDRVRSVCPIIRQEPMGDCGHFFQLEEPAITSALLRAFADDVMNDPRLQPRDSE